MRFSKICNEYILRLYYQKNMFYENNYYLKERK